MKSFYSEERLKFKVKLDQVVQVIEGFLNISFEKTALSDDSTPR